MSKTHGRCPNFHNLLQIKIMFPVSQCTAHPPPVLMTGNSIHRIFFTIQEETFSSHSLIFTQAEWLYHFINYLSVLFQTRDDLI